ncbi:MAG: PDZ domain-containing protein, partial [Proteobacteria bacterium]
MRRLLLALIVLVFASQEKLLAAPKLDESILRIYSYVQKPDFDSPWTTRQSERIAHMGLVVAGDKILVSAYAVRSAKHFEAERIGESKRYPLKLKMMDPVANLGILEFSEDKPEGLEPIEFGDDMEIGANCTIYQGIEGETLVPRPLRLREVQVQAGVLTSYGIPQYVLEIRKPGYGWFEPLMRNGKLVGAAISQSGSSVFAMPVSLLKRFVDEIKRDVYRPFAELGISYSSLLSPAQRRYAKADDSEEGVWVQEVKETSAFVKDLQPSDILLQVNDIPVSARGSFEHPLWGRISLVGALTDIYAGDKVTLKYMRDGAVKTVTRAIGAYQPELERVPSVIDSNPRYLIFGGLVIQELTEGLLQSWGANWRKRAPLPYLYEDAFHSWPENGGATKVLVLQRV